MLILYVLQTVVPLILIAWLTLAPPRSATGFWTQALATGIGLLAIGTKTAFIKKAGPWENGYCESFNGKLGDELLNGERFYTLKEAQVLIESWRRHYNAIRPHSSLGYRPSRQPLGRALRRPRSRRPRLTGMF